jgi:hypothetical protein
MAKKNKKAVAAKALGKDARTQMLKDLKKIVALIERVDTPMKIYHAHASQIIKTAEADGHAGA